MGKITGFLAFLIAFGQPLVAVGQPARHECPLCRAVAAFRTCLKPLDGAAVAQGKVIDVQKGKCSQILSLEILKPTEVRLPAQIQVGIGPCAHWEGKIGDVIAVATHEPFSPDNHTYSLACRHW